MAFKLDGKTFAVGFLVGLIFEFCVSLLPWNQQKTQWVTTSGWRVDGACTMGAESDAVMCACDAQHGDDEVHRELAVDDSIAAAFARDEDTKKMCDELCLKSCFALAQLRMLEEL